MLYQMLGSLSAIILVASLAAQLHHLWRHGRVCAPRRSGLLLQCAAAAGFLASSAALGGPVLALVSALLLASAAAALVALPRQRRSRLPGASGRVIWLASMRFAGRGPRGARASQWHPASASMR